ncbi:MAG: LD-carboxypeptidase [Longimicrobiales bacterium]|nr:LD-carboxypeptidase [Longimicrobiales bacterium]
MIYPPALRPGDTVALIAPAGPVDGPTIDRALERCRRLGLQPDLGPNARARTGYLAGEDGDRADDLRRAIEGDAAGIWALRGGYGTLRTLEHVDLSPLRARPKSFIGFSDNTAVHLALLREGIVSFHGPHAGFEHFPAATAAAFRAVVMTPEPAGPLPVSGDRSVRPEALVPGTAEGPLIGGNLSLLAATCGTRYQPDTRGAILFFEDVGEATYRLDRMLMQLRLAGMLDDVAGVAIGDLAGSGEEAAARDVVAELLGRLEVPVAFGLPFGHGEENWTLPLGVPARLDADAGTLALLEAATTRAEGVA